MASSLFTSTHTLSNTDKSSNIDKSVSRFPVPDISTLPQDLQERFGIVSCIIIYICASQNNDCILNSINYNDSVKYFIYYNTILNESIH